MKQRVLPPWPSVSIRGRSALAVSAGICGDLRPSSSVLLLAAVLGAACRPAPAPRPAAPAASYRVVDVMPRFFAWWDRDVPAAAGDTAAMIASFRARVIGPDTAFYRRAAGGPTDDRVRGFIRGVGRDVPAMRAIAARLGDDLSRYRRQFADSFPDFAYDGSVYFYPSLYIRDGGTMSFPPSTALMFGLDMIARLNGPRADLGVLFHHELFHVYHAQRQASWAEALRARGGRRPFYLSVWGEGLATYASGRMNPGRSDVDLLLQDSTLAREGTRRLPRLAAILLRHMDEAPDSVRRVFQQFGTRHPEIPARSGYLVGLRVAELVGRGRSLRELAALREEALRPEFEAALRRLAGG